MLRFKKFLAKLFTWREKKKLINDQGEDKNACTSPKRSNSKCQDQSAKYQQSKGSRSELFDFRYGHRF
jgi:hypothetical protein